ncbi:Hypothetical predicted protein [Paramuricea clavata]|uniref:Reverse transcriptase domain-containing protein n=1 Tax=Paramuricea clavata TaxID=317549 RepID=A0A7D9HMX1_PARCT|nr:Hypothetical predicted protein [Paramuricea clavata]
MIKITCLLIGNYRSKRKIWQQNPTGTGPILCGRNLLDNIRLDWSSIRRLGKVNFEDVLKKYDHLFNEELGMLHGIKAKIRLKPMPKPTFYRAHSVPYSMQSKIEKELERIEEIHNKLAGGKTFTELDQSHAYEPMVLDEDSKECVTINTHRGLYRYNRLPYGVSSAPGIFQKTIEGLLNGIPFTGALLDNILISGATDDEHLRNLEEVMKRLSEAGLR